MLRSLRSVTLLRSTIRNTPTPTPPPTSALFHTYRGGASGQDNKTKENDEPQLASDAAADPNQLASDAAADPEVVKKQAFSRFRTLWKRYGWVGVSTYLGVYVTTLSGLYVTIKAGGIVPGDVSELVKDSHIASFHLPGLSTTDLSVNKSTGDFALAWIATKLTEPLRLAFTLAITPSVSRAVHSLRNPKSVQPDDDESVQPDNDKGDDNGDTPRTN